jgi:hypothetical protein
MDYGFHLINTQVPLILMRLNQINQVPFLWIMVFTLSPLNFYSGKFMTIKLWISLTSIKPESPRFHCFQRKMEKYKQNPKIRSFQIKTNKMPEITGKGVGYIEGRC